MDFDTASFWDILLWRFWVFIWISAVFIWVRCLFDLFSDDTTSVTIGAIVASVEASSGLVYFAPHSIMNSCP